MERSELVAYQAGLDLAASRPMTLADFDRLDVLSVHAWPADVLDAYHRSDPDTFRAWVGRGILDYYAEHG